MGRRWDRASIRRAEGPMMLRPVCSRAPRSVGWAQPAAGPLVRPDRPGRQPGKERSVPRQGEMDDGNQRGGEVEHRNRLHNGIERSSESYTVVAFKVLRCTSSVKEVSAQMFGRTMTEPEP